MINQREQAERGKKMKELIRASDYKGQYLIFSMFEIYGYISEPVSLDFLRTVVMNTHPRGHSEPAPTSAAWRMNG